MPLTQLTEAERHLCYECLGVPNATDVLNVNSDFGTGSRFQSMAVTGSKTDIDTRIEALDTAAEGGDEDAAARVARLKVLLAEWERVSTSNVDLKPNAANEGVSIRPSRKRRLIRERVQKIIPVFVEAIDGESAGGIPLG